ncbi:hypothetical protein DSUL_60125 [Desulfovibrionales bacterium]
MQELSVDLQALTITQTALFLTPVVEHDSAITVIFLIFLQSEHTAQDSLNR